MKEKRTASHGAPRLDTSRQNHRSSGPQQTRRQFFLIISKDMKERFKVKEVIRKMNRHLPNLARCGDSGVCEF